jgi:hypothetical protein
MGIVVATFRLVAQCLNWLCQFVPLEKEEGLNTLDNKWRGTRNSLTQKFASISIYEISATQLLKFETSSEAKLNTFVCLDFLIQGRGGKAPRIKHGQNGGKRVSCLKPLSTLYLWADFLLYRLDKRFGRSQRQARRFMEIIRGRWRRDWAMRKIFANKSLCFAQMFRYLLQLR